MRQRLTQTFLRLLALLTAEVLVLGFAMALCLLLFLLMAHLVFNIRDSTLDNALFAFADRLASPQMTQAMRVISFFASAEYLLVTPPLVVLVFSFFRAWRWYALKVLLISFSTSILNQALKRFFERPRPAFALLEQSGLSFPSGHAMIGGAFYGLLIYIVWHTVRHKVWRWVSILLLTLLVLLIGFSRIYLKVHYATDVLAGYGIGFMWLIVSVYLMRRLELVYINRYERRP
ncbi:phosphatase PAP2 family protein [Pontibacter anaerobius]|uniref:Phosphatase PAP2 family protein n=1 Tax=Pontibacter anaerobius TaxID=2993940 RepID=A0ABT3RDU3_9BACT|nr:phosphatase PAP2 family protein [Pontibacter anaerobius]MCX2740021.1 phosphatase PAP2 family protein [Pontibacter anaerobius]